jgi:aspartyl-tRNA(Asn)/glutamyl-tRNA(Gln) amidotransferase subunit B
MMTQSLAFARYYEAARDRLRPAQAGGQLADGRGEQAPERRGARAPGCAGQPGPAGAADRPHPGRHHLQQRRPQVFDALWTGAGSEVDAVIEAKGLKQMNDSGALEKIVDEVIAANAKSVEEYKSGKDKAFNALVGQVMKASKGKANPAQATSC